jgi:hypothetical protein
MTNYETRRLMGWLGRRLGGMVCLPLALGFMAAFACAPLRAQVDLAGEWTENLHEDMPERGDVAIGDYLSVPINDATRLRADTWDAEQWTMVEHLCHAHPLDYAPRGPSQMRIWSDVDPLTQGIAAWHTIISYMLPERTIYMDGRPHPPEWAAHTWQGFSTGEWVGDMLKVTTTHLKEGYFRRNGLARSEKATVTEYFIRYPTTLTLVTIVEDPVYLTEPFVITSDWVQDIGRQLSPNFCISSVEIDHPKGWVAYHLPGKNPWLNEYSQRTGVPYEAVRGGAETMYPEYQKKLATMPVPPPLPSESSEKGR